MSTEIRRNIWAKFFRQFNAANQYRQAEISVVGRNKKERKTIALGDRPFLGMTLAKKGRLIDGVQMCTANENPDQLTEPIVTVKDPARIMLEKDDEGRDKALTVVSKDGTTAKIELGNYDEQLPANLVRKVAYQMYMRRGINEGNAQDDWYTAEKKVKETELDFVR